LIELSVIVAVYNEDPRNLANVIERLDQIITPTGTSYEIIFVNDGSRPPATMALRQLAADNDKVKLVELSRNFGQQAAITCGLDHSEGLAVINIDSDLQDPPELIPQMLERWKEGYDVVFAQRQARRDRFLKRASAYVFYRVLGSISSVQIPFDSGDYRLMDRKVVDALASLPEKTRFLRGMIPWLGFSQIGISIDRGAREVGESTYTLKKLLTLAMDGILAFSIMPLYAIAAVGAIVAGVSLLALIASLVFASGAAYWPMIVISSLGVFAGLQIICTGVVAVYLSSVLNESRARPTYVVGAKLGGGFSRTSGATANNFNAKDKELLLTKINL
jgi:glycosyltransferase involved in cell wall biosynthesis